MSNSSHPYDAYEHLPAWKVLDKAMQELIDNGDVEATTARQHIVGYLTKQLADRELTLSGLDDRTLLTPVNTTADA